MDFDYRIDQCHSSASKIHVRVIDRISRGGGIARATVTESRGWGSGVARVYSLVFSLLGFPVPLLLEDVFATYKRVMYLRPRSSTTFFGTCFGGFSVCSENRGKKRS